MKLNLLVAIAVTLLSCAAVQSKTPTVTVMRVPEKGIQPQLAADGTGTFHLIYFKGDPKHGDIFYSRSTDAGATFSTGIRVNSQPGSVIAAGTVRGPQIAVGRGGRPHVVWMGSDDAMPRAPGGEARTVPLLYARLDDRGAAFEPQRNLITANPGLDGGLSVAADQRAGDVYAVWHAPEAGKKGEDARRVWVARSTDDGQTFSPETAANPEPTGLCGCCGMRAFCDREGNLYITYRSAQEIVNRDMYLLVSRDHAKTFTSTKLDSMKIGICVMSTTMLVQQPPEVGNGVLASWETQDRVFFAPAEAARVDAQKPIAAPDEVKPSKHPALAINLHGQTLFAWTEGTRWQKGGVLAWQVFDETGRAIPGAKGRAPNLPVWSLPAAFARPDGSFVVMY